MNFFFFFPLQMCIQFRCQHDWLCIAFIGLSPNVSCLILYTQFLCVSLQKPSNTVVKTSEKNRTLRRSRLDLIVTYVELGRIHNHLHYLTTVTSRRRIKHEQKNLKYSITKTEAIKNNYKTKSYSKCVHFGFRVNREWQWLFLAFKKECKVNNNKYKQCAYPYRHMYISLWLMINICYKTKIKQDQPSVHNTDITKPMLHVSTCTVFIHKKRSFFLSHLWWIYIIDINIDIDRYHYILFMDNNGNIEENILACNTLTGIRITL